MHKCNCFIRLLQNANRNEPNVSIFCLVEAAFVEVNRLINIAIQIIKNEPDILISFYLII